MVLAVYDPDFQQSAAMWPPPFKDPCQARSSMSCVISGSADQSAGVPDRPTLLIVGGSTRAAAESARRAGWHPICADLYADLDLQAVATVLPVANYPTSLPGDVATVSAQCWMYTGGLENHPTVIAQLEQVLLSRGCQLWGTPAAQLSRFREPQQVDELAIKAGWQRPRRLPTEPTVSRAGRWLHKQGDGAGGMGVSWSEPDCLNTGWLEEYIAGPVCSAVYHLTAAGPLLIGTALQFPGESSARAPGPFVFCAAISVDLETLAIGNPSLPDQLSAMGDCLSAQGARGLIGVDFVQTSRAPTLLEINPRYTATTELHELRQRVCALPVMSPVSPVQLGTAQLGKRKRVVGKMIVYAGQALVMPLASCNFGDFYRQPWDLPVAADVSPAETPIPAGAPACTVYASAGSPQRCLQRLRRQAEWVQRQIAMIETFFGEPHS